MPFTISTFLMGLQWGREATTSEHTTKKNTKMKTAAFCSAAEEVQGS